MLEYTADRQISINHNPVTLPELETRLRDIFETRKDKTMFIAGDGSLRYGDIVAVVDAAKGAGITRSASSPRRCAAAAARRQRRQRRPARTSTPGAGQPAPGQRYDTGASRPEARPRALYGSFPLPASRSQLPAPSYPLPATRSQLPASRFQLRAGDRSWMREAEAGSRRKRAAGSWELEAGSWKPEAGSWKLEAGSCVQTKGRQRERRRPLSVRPRRFRRRRSSSAIRWPASGAPSPRLSAGAAWRGPSRPGPPAAGGAPCRRARPRSSG